jgi:hemoglobin-like flavoprotein
LDSWIDGSQRSINPTIRIEEIMRPEQIALVQNTFDFLWPMTDTVAALFYLRLFEVAPGLRPMFNGDMKEQAHKLMQMLGYVVNGLNNPENMLAEVRELGQRHLEYGVKAEHYRTVGEVLLWTLKRALDEDFTPEVEEAWTEAHALLADVMKSAAARQDEVNPQKGNTR